MTNISVNLKYFYLSKARKENNNVGRKILEKIPKDFLLGGKGDYCFVLFVKWASSMISQEKLLFHFGQTVAEVWPRQKMLHGEVISADYGRRCKLLENLPWSTGHGSVVWKETP